MKPFEQVNIKMPQPLYDTIGNGYAQLRRPDERIAAAILDGLGCAPSVVNVGAGTGSYEPCDRKIVAVEPSKTMIDQRTQNPSTIVQATGDSLPFCDRSFDAALAILTIHHWPHQQRGLRELRRVARDRVVILTWDPEAPGFWLTDYFPRILDIDGRIFPPIEEFRRALGPVTIAPVPIPWDCTDGFLGAYWRRPKAYLDPKVRSAISTFSKLENPNPGLERLADDLRSGRWVDQYGEILNLSTLDLGYRLVIAH